MFKIRPRTLTCIINLVAVFMQNAASANVCIRRADSPDCGWPPRRCSCLQCGGIPVNTTNLPKVRPMLGHRRRRWANIGQTLGRFVVFAGMEAARDRGRGGVGIGEGVGQTRVRQDPAQVTNPQMHNNMILIMPGSERHRPRLSQPASIHHLKANGRNATIPAAAMPLSLSPCVQPHPLPLSFSSK